MSWDDAAQVESNLKRALGAFNWSEAEAICAETMERIKSEAELIPEKTAKSLLGSLRRKRRFRLMSQLAEALLQSGLRTPQIRRQYAQSLIDQGLLAGAELVLQSIVQDSQGNKVEELEARGLIGRIYKQTYVNNRDSKSPQNRLNLERALNEYLFVYRLGPEDYLWQGINVVALSDLARREHLPLGGLPEATPLAQEILLALEKRGSDSAWDEATRMEAYLALGSLKDAADAALRYIDSADADAFEIGSTIRQLTEVWGLNDKESPGNLLLPILKAGHLKKEGAVDQREPQKVKEEAIAVDKAGEKWEALFGKARPVTLTWYKKGLEQCNSIARIERLDGQGHGTGWLVEAGDFFAGKNGVLLLTNAHVVSSPPNFRSILPEDCQVNFQAAGEVLSVEEEVVWTCPPTRLDATFLALKRKPSAPPLRLHKRAVEMADPAPRMYIIGHPSGRDLELSLQDNNLLACKGHLVHYRTPTETGSSGSPVFEPEDWRVVALHHKGTQAMPRIDGKEGTYEANEGVAILSIQEATRNSKT